MQFVGRVHGLVVADQMSVRYYFGRTNPLSLAELRILCVYLKRLQLPNRLATRIRKPFRNRALQRTRGEKPRGLPVRLRGRRPAETIGALMRAWSR